MTEKKDCVKIRTEMEAPVRDTSVLVASFYGKNYRGRFWMYDKKSDNMASVIKNKPEEHLFDIHPEDLPEIKAIIDKLYEVYLS